jgi:hypothetical protein
MEEKKIWSMDELVALTDEVSIEEVIFRDRVVEFQYCELTEAEEPKLTALSEDLPEDEKMGVYQEIGSQRVMRMIAKANAKNPTGPIIKEEQWSLLPTTLRYAISNRILGAEKLSEDFRD